MTARELRDWAKDPRSKLAGTPVGHKRPSQIAELLETQDDGWTRAQTELARTVDHYNFRHLAQGTYGRPVAGHDMSRREISLRNWGHDPRRSGALDPSGRLRNGSAPSTVKSPKSRQRGSAMKQGEFFPRTKESGWSFGGGRA